MDKSSDSNSIEENIKVIKKRVIKFILYILIIFCSALGYGVYWLYFDLDRLPRGSLIEEQSSPKNTYTIKLYLSDAGATTSYSIIGELNYNKENKLPKVIYFQYRKQIAEINWIDDTTVIINGKKLNVLHDKYDYRHD